MTGGGDSALNEPLVEKFLGCVYPPKRNLVSSEGTALQTFFQNTLVFWSNFSCGLKIVSMSFSNNSTGSVQTVDTALHLSQLPQPLRRDRSFLWS